MSVEPESKSLGEGKTKRGGFTLAARTKVMASAGKLRRGQNLRKRVASFTTGVAVGGKDFVVEVIGKPGNQQKSEAFFRGDFEEERCEFAAAANGR
ncbi:MAG: hypothetical protein ACJAVK_001879 [Akkermansiaceae bacterium]|jgi:hypothetical protein